MMQNDDDDELICPECGLSFDDPAECSQGFDIEQFYKTALRQGVKSGRIVIAGFEDNGEEFLEKIIGKEKG